MRNLTSVEREDKKLIFIVDDQERNLEVLGSLLRSNSYNVMIASSGMEALKMVEKKLPDLILLDIMMPKMDGYEVCQRLKENDLTKELPIIFLTAKSETEDLVKGFRLGGMDYITKPFSNEELLVRIKNHLELKSSKDIILKQNQELIKLNKDKNHFLSIAAHDLKNPLFTVKGFSQLISKKNSNLDMKDIRDYADYISTTADQCLQIIINLLDVNAIEEGAMRLVISKFDLDSILQEVVDSYLHKAANKNIKLFFEAEDENNLITADINKVKQIIDNLVSNAVKFSPQDKSIFINSKKIINEEGDNVALVSIIDEGPGITEEDKCKMFKKFSKLSAQPTGEENSTGLGLSIVKSLSEAMNGKVWCESKSGEGATFFVEFPEENEDGKELS